ncbi:hypothetical protein EJ04DRAFT_594260 [Polyplosphaeria fusca]|uniref:Uncharacterized protein n=1 Tax=Polyplosphaeria fusca TaxID=682080 RepID=A0A9P4QMS7_9PLEO|nr:hypothetical protein EJ04DRAFT_594260 [Polyplosphaeria fusca]
MSKVPLTALPEELIEVIFVNFSPAPDAGDVDTNLRTAVSISLTSSQLSRIMRPFLYKNATVRFLIRQWQMSNLKIESLLYALYRHRDYARFIKSYLDAYQLACAYREDLLLETLHPWENGIFAHLKTINIHKDNSDLSDLLFILRLPSLQVAHLYIKTIRLQDPRHASGRWGDIRVKLTELSITNRDPRWIPYQTIRLLAQACPALESFSLCVPISMHQFSRAMLDWFRVFETHICTGVLRRIQFDNPPWAHSFPVGELNNNLGKDVAQFLQRDDAKIESIKLDLASIINQEKIDENFEIDLIKAVVPHTPHNLILRWNPRHTGYLTNALLRLHQSIDLWLSELESIVVELPRGHVIEDFEKIRALFAAKAVQFDIYYIR